MFSSLPSADGFLATIVLATLAIGLPIVMVLSIRFLWDRKLNLGRSKELEAHLAIAPNRQRYGESAESAVFCRSGGRAAISRCRRSPAACHATGRCD